MNLKDNLLTALSAANRAGSAILEIYDKHFEIRYKEDRSPLTLADRRSHEIIIQHLEQQTDNPLPILSEEGKDIPFEHRKSWDYFWLVDPLDGTKEFIKRNGEFTVNLALIHKNRPVLGVVYIPVRDVYYFAAEGLGAYRLNGETGIDLNAERLPEREKTTLLNTVIARSARLPIDSETSESADHSTIQPFNHSTKTKPLTIVGSRSHATRELEEFVEVMRKKYQQVEFIAAGSSLKLCLVAEGRADIYPRLGPTMEWDTAAGQAVVEQAEGSVLDAGTDEPLRYNKENLLNPWFIVRRKFFD
ncbi:MAG: 3'(2'),5'-bisphosphate nucleotidase CysQ [Pseudomonadota bacterium]|nr:3'(2'),5'-bisphosphate nucleotidase CysQ [Pseudomonadota bacterium]